jgi:hypothetical protein
MKRFLLAGIELGASRTGISPSHGSVNGTVVLKKGKYISRTALLSAQEGQAMVV